MGLFTSKAKTVNIESTLDKQLYKLPGTREAITWADSVEGTLITGATGSGKSSGPGKHIAISMLKSGFGMCILCAKTDEKERWVRYIKDEAPEREKDLVIFNKASNLNFNFLQYEMERFGEGAGNIVNAVNAIMNLNEQSKVYQGGGNSANEERFWDNSVRRLISRTITLLRLADEEVSIPNMRKIVAHSFAEEEIKLFEETSALASSKLNVDPQKREEAKADIDLWKKANYFLQVLLKVRSKAFSSYEKREEANLIDDYWMKEFARLSERPRSIIVESFMGIIEPFVNDGILKKQFSSGLSEELLPENIIRDHKIIIIDFPIKEFGLAGIYASILYKTTFMAAMERRNVADENDPKPIGLWIDEYQSFCNPMTDSLFQTTARSSWVATVYITQNINNIYFVMGQSMAEARAKSLLGNLNLKYFASNADFDTNKWASEMIGQHLVNFKSVSYNKDADLTHTENQQMQFRITPDHFTTLKTGRKVNNHIVEAVVFKPGRIWDADKNFAIIKFDQT